jgi:transcription elongation factor Elf1
MAVARCDDSSPYGMTCPQCNDLMIAPSRSVYVSRNSALHCWSCDTCGHDAEIRLVQPSVQITFGDIKTRVFFDG